MRWPVRAVNSVCREPSRALSPCFSLRRNGFVSYALSNGQPDGSDPWGENATYHHWMELNATKTDLHGITVFEPCNWVSNVAYYHAVTAVCDKTDWYSPPAVSGALAQSLAMLAAGSAFYHASGTILGGALRPTTP